LFADRDAQPDDRAPAVDGATHQPVGSGRQPGRVAVVLLG
jgi:hypothetical protein